MAVFELCQLRRVRRRVLLKPIAQLQSLPAKSQSPPLMPVRVDEANGRQKTPFSSETADGISRLRVVSPDDDLAFTAAATEAFGVQLRAAECFDCLSRLTEETVWRRR
jgi:hypothetical protein